MLIILADQLAGAADQASSARKALYKATTGQLSLPSDFDVSATSAGEMFLGAFIPGLILVAVYVVFIAAIAFVRPRIAPAMRYEGKFDRAFAGKVVMALVPPLALIFVVLGSIILGIATVNQAGAIGSAGALIMAGYRLHDGRRGAYWPAALALVSVIIIAVVAYNHPLNIKNLATGTDYVWLTIAIIAVAGLLAGLIWSGWRALVVENTLRGVMIETAKTTALVFIILIGAAMLTAAFRGFGGEELVRHFLTGMPGGFWGQFVIVMAVIFILGFFLDFIEIAVVVVPIVAPILLMDPGANVTAVWLGVMVGLNIQTSFLTPPFGFALFYLRGVAPAVVKTLSIYKGVIPFIIMQLLVLAFVAVTPRLVNYLPQRIALTSATAPPPINPRLQLCIEDNIADQFRTRGQAIRAAIAQARQIDPTGLPAGLRKEVAASFDKADAAFGLLDQAIAAEAAIDARAKTYAPLHHKVRDIEADMQQHDARLRAIPTELRRASGQDAAAQKRRAALKAERARLEAERKPMQATIPANWNAEHKAFTQLLQAERRARLTYRRNVDSAYEPIAKTIEIIDAVPALAALKGELEGLNGIINSQTPQQAADKLAVLLKTLGAIPATNDVRSELSKARRALRGRPPNKDNALAAVTAALSKFELDVAWRQRAARDVLPALRRYDEAIRDTIGLRKQPRLPHQTAVAIAGCLAYHRDISLQF